MHPIDPRDLVFVVGGMGGALLGSLLQNAGPILNGVGNIIAASKSGGGGAAPPAAAAPPPPSIGASDDPRVSITVSVGTPA